MSISIIPTVLKLDANFQEVAAETEASVEIVQKLVLIMGSRHYRGIRETTLAPNYFNPLCANQRRES